MAKKTLLADCVAQEFWESFDRAKRGEIKTSDLIGLCRPLEGIVRIHANKLKFFQLSSTCPSQELKEELSVK